MEQQPYEPDLEKLFLASLGSFGSLGSNTAGIVQMFQNGVDKKTLIGMTKRLIKNFGNLAEEAYEKEPDWKRVFRGKYEIATKGEKTWFREYIKDYKFSSEKSVGKKIKVGTNWAGVVFSGILNAIDNYEEFGTTKSKRFWEETLLETAFEVMEDITVRAVVSVALTAICGGATVVAISAVTVGVIWAIDVANGYITEKSGGESKRAAEAVSDFILDIGKTKKGEESVMENLKAIIVFLLFWSIVIWCARIIKRKRDKQMMEFSEELPEMELVTDEEERKYICKNMVEMGKLENLFWGLVFLLNWWTIVRAIVEICQEWSNGIAYELLEMSLLIAINGVIAENYKTTIKRKRICESGVVKKKIVHIKSYRDFGYGSTEGVIEGKEGEIGIDLNRDEDLPFKRDGDMAMLVWLENGENSLLPRMKPKDESNKKE